MCFLCSVTQTGSCPVSIHALQFNLCLCPLALASRLSLLATILRTLTPTLWSYLSLNNPHHIRPMHNCIFAHNIPMKRQVGNHTPSVNKYFAFWVWSKSNFLNFDQILTIKYKHLQYKNYCIRIFSKHIFILCLFGIMDIDTLSSILSQSLQNLILTKPRMQTK
jgi:hypothetical protein